MDVTALKNMLTILMKKTIERMPSEFQELKEIVNATKHLLNEGGQVLE